MANKTNYFWYLGGSAASIKLALVEKGSVTKNGFTSEYKTIQLTGTNNVRIRGKFTDYDIDLSLYSEWSSIPERFHKAIVDKVIAMGYRDLRNKDLQSAEYFEQVYEKQLKKAKARITNMQGTGNIVPQDF